MENDSKETTVIRDILRKLRPGDLDEINKISASSDLFETNFFDSLLFLELLCEIEKTIGRELEMSAIDSSNLSSIKMLSALLL